MGRAISVVSWIGFFAAGGCTSLDPSDEQRRLTADLGTAVGIGVTIPDADESLQPSPEVAELLAAPVDELAAVRIALLNNHSVRAAYDRLGIARADLVQAGLLRNPAFDLDARFVEGGGTDLEFGLSQPILELFFLPLRQRLAEHEFEAAKLRITEELVGFVAAVRRAHVVATAAENTVALRREALAAAVAAHDLRAELYAAGNTTDQVLAMDRVAESQARLDLAEAELDASSVKEHLQEQLGLWGPHTVWSLAALPSEQPLDGVDLERIEARAVERSLDLRAHRQGLDGLAQRAGLDSWRGWFPELIVGPNGIRMPGGTWGFGPRLEGELPLFDTGSTRRERNRAALRAGMRDFVQLGVAVRAAARRLRERAAVLADRVRFYRDTHLPHRDQVVRATLQVYNAMQIGAFDALAQKRVQIDDRIAYVRTLRDAHLARIDLWQLLAGSMPDDSSHRPRAGTDHGGMP